MNASDADAAELPRYDVDRPLGDADQPGDGGPRNAVLAHLADIGAHVIGEDVAGRSHHSIPAGYKSGRISSALTLTSAATVSTCHRGTLDHCDTAAGVMRHASAMCLTALRRDRISVRI